MISGPKGKPPAKSAAATPATKPGARPEPPKPAPPPPPPASTGWKPRAAGEIKKASDGFAAAAPAKPPASTRPYDGSADATALYTAMKGGLFGAGTDEAGLFRALEGKTPAQVDSIKRAYSDHYRRELVSDLKSELGGAELNRALALLKGDAAAAAAERLHEAMGGLGTKESEVFAALQGKKPEEISAIRQRFEQKHGSLDRALAGELSGDALRRARALVAGDAAGAEAAALHQAMAGLGTDEKAILGTLEGKPPPERAAVIAAYQRQYGKDLRQDLKKELGGGQALQAAALLDGNSARADAAKLVTALEGLGSDEKAVLRTLEGTSAPERAAISAEYQKLTGRELPKDLRGDLSGRDLLRAETLLANGKLSGVEELRLAMSGPGTDEEKIKEVLTGRTKGEIDQLKAEYQAKYGKDLLWDLRGELGGRDAHDVTQNLKGIPASAEEALQRMNEDRSFERGGWKNAASRFVLDRLTGKGDLLDSNVERANAFLAKAKQDGKLDDAEKARLAQLIGYTRDDVALYRTAKDSAANGAATIATTAAAVGVAVATAGAGAPLVVAAVAGAGAGAGSRVLTKGVLAGEGYSLGDAAMDGAIGAIEGASSAVGAGAARNLVGGAMASVASAAETSTAARVAVFAANGAAQGAVSGGINAAGNAAFTDTTWDSGFGEGLADVALAGVKGAAIGAVASGTLGALKGLRAPQVVYVTESDVAGEKLDLTQYRSDETTRSGSRQWLANDQANYGAKVDVLQSQHPALANIADEDLMALKAYTGNYYKDMNTALRGKSWLWRTRPGMASGVKSASSALNQLPSHQGTVYRGAQLNAGALRRYAEGKLITERAFMSTTVDPNVAEKFGGGNALFVINSVKNGRDVSFLSDFANEKEVLFAPGTAFKVLAKQVDEASGRTVIFLNEVQ